jgi:hypothetical protein
MGAKHPGGDGHAQEDLLRCPVATDSDAYLKRAIKVVPSRQMPPLHSTKLIDPGPRPGCRTPASGPPDPGFHRPGPAGAPRRLQ